MGAKNVKFWTLITIDSDKCDPKRLTPRQQLAYIARRSGGIQSTSQLLSDFRVAEDVERGELGGLGVEGAGLVVEEEGLVEDLAAIAAEDVEPSVADVDELIEMAEAEEEENPHEQEIFEDAYEISTSQIPPECTEEANIDRADSTADKLGYLSPDIAAFFSATAAIQHRRLAILTAERTTRLQTPTTTATTKAITTSHYNN